MKWLYIWNDLDLFTHNSKILEYAYERLQELITPISSAVTYKILSIHDYKLSLSFNLPDCLVAIGTRPHLLLNQLNKKHFHLNINRKHDNLGNSIIIPTHLNLKEKNIFLSFSNAIHIYEDVCVSGETILELKRLMDMMEIESKRITIHLFCANKKNIIKLKSKTGFYFFVYHYMDGNALQDSTLLCLSDLLFGKLGNKKYTERRDLLENFFPDRYNEFINCIFQIHEKWVSYE